MDPMGMGIGFLKSPKIARQELAFRSTFLEYLGGCVNSAKPPSVEFCKVLLLIKNTESSYCGKDVFLVDSFFGGGRHSVEVDLFPFVFYIGPPVQIGSIDTPLEMCRSSTPTESTAGTCNSPFKKGTTSSKPPTHELGFNPKVSFPNNVGRVRTPVGNSYLYNFISWVSC